MKQFPFLFVLIILAMLAGACGGIVTDSPKQTVVKLFGAMERNDKGEIAHVLDLPLLMAIKDRDYALQLDTPRILRSPTDILEDLIDSGQTKNMWFSMKRVVGAEEVLGDTAFVEVTFLSETSGRRYYNKFGLHRLTERWRIYSFKTPIDTT
ncbi:MAG: hypothetical protein IH914_02175 [candidate division Zixibacteria bacterium]|nr:hypothetical protein [candidate division Zixibacteria bacterium]